MRGFPKGVGVAELRAVDAGYDAARQGWNLVVEQSLRVIMDAETTRDVQTAARHARANGLPVAAMATGQGTPRACDGLLIRVGRMIGVRVYT